MLTAAVRDLHRTYPDKYLTDVRTSFPDLWLYNPYVTKLSDSDPEIKTIECDYPLINHADTLPYHCLHGFRHFLNNRLGLHIQPTAFCGDLHIGRREKSWHSQVWEMASREVPFWLIAAGGKFDVTIKWWDVARYQQVVDHFRGRIQFVQVGAERHHHPKLNGVIDLRGRTDVRQLVRLVYHAQGVLCGVTGLMHLAAAVEYKWNPASHRPCVVVAGGREPPHWEAYPFHQFVHTVGALECCRAGGCWRDRTVPLGDGDERDHPRRLCQDIRGNLPRCMDMISAEEVIRRVELYFDGGVCRYLRPAEAKAGVRGVEVTQGNPVDLAPLSVHTARLAADQYIAKLPPKPLQWSGRGIVICGGGHRYFPCAWVCVQMLRRFGCNLPIQLWHLGAHELDARMEQLMASLKVECVNAQELLGDQPMRRIGGWELKAYAIAHSPFREALFLDADNVPVMNPEYLFDCPQFNEMGAVFWPDYGRLSRSRPIWRLCGVRYQNEPEFETGQMLIDKERHWEPLALALWYNAHSDFFYQWIHGDKETFHMAWRKLGRPYAMPPRPIEPLAFTMCQHDFEGRRVFQHRNLDKWSLMRPNRSVRGFRFEKECLRYVDELRAVWDGRIGVDRAHKVDISMLAASPKLSAVILTNHCRQSLAVATCQRLALTDWAATPVPVALDGSGASRDAGREQLFLRVLRRFLHESSDYLLLFADDLEFNLFLGHNLHRWQPLLRRQVKLASLFNPGVREIAGVLPDRCVTAHSQSLFRTEAMLISRHTATLLLERWNQAEGPLPERITRLAAGVGTPLYYHCPSLVRCPEPPRRNGGGFVRAIDYDPNWRA